MDSEAKMVVETNTIVKELKERMDRHSHDYERTFQGIWDEMKEMRREVGESIGKIKEKVLEIETQRGILLKVVTPIISAIFGTAAGLISGHLKP